MEVSLTTHSAHYFHLLEKLNQAWKPVDEDGIREHWKAFSEREANKHISHAHLWRVACWQQAISFISRQS